MKLIAYYDGDCGLCSAFVRFAFARQRSEMRVEFRPYQSARAEELGRYGLDADRCSRGFMLVEHESGTLRAEGGPAVRAVLRGGGGIVGFLAGAVDALPPLLWAERRIYPLIARNRARISVAIGTTACNIPPAREP